VFLQRHSNLPQQLQDVGRLLGTERYPIISEHRDELLSREQNYGVNEAPQDYLDSFNAFIRDQINQSAALSVIVNRPRDLTRAQLKEVRLLLDQHGYSEAHLRGAWRASTQQEVAASIIGHIRRAALGEALTPFDQRVERAMQGIYAQQAWTPVQRKWLARLAQQLVHEVVMGREDVQRVFIGDGGAPKLDRLLDGRLDQVLDTLGETVWERAG